MNNQNQFNPGTAQGLQFCPKCSTPLDPNGLCPNCAKQADPEPPVPQQSQGFNYGQPVQPGAPQQSQGFNYSQPVQPAAPQQPQGFQYGQPVQPAAPQQQGYQQPAYQRPAPKAPAMPNILTDALAYIKAFFSADPMTVLDKAANEKQHIWSILGSGSILLVTLGIFGVILNIINKIYDMIYSLIAGLSGIPFVGGAIGNAMGGTADIESEINGVKVKLFFLVLLIIAAFFFASAGLDTLFFTLQKKKADYVQNMNVLSAAMLPLAVCGGAAFILSFIYIPLSVVLLLAGLFCKTIMLYDGLKKVAEFGKDTIWYVFGLIASNIVAFGLIAYLLSEFMF